MSGADVATQHNVADDNATWLMTAGDTPKQNTSSMRKRLAIIQRSVASTWHLALSAARHADAPPIEVPQWSGTAWYNYGVAL